MNYGPLEFANYLQRKAAPNEGLRVVAGPPVLSDALASPGESVLVYEAVALVSPRFPVGAGAVRVLVKAHDRPVALVLIAHQRVEWRIACAPGASLPTILLSGLGHSTVSGAEGAAVHRIGSFCSFRRGSEAWMHLQSEVLRCTGRMMACYQSLRQGDHFEIG